jgi:hypothetical protein
MLLRIIISENSAKILYVKIKNTKTIPKWKNTELNANVKLAKIPLFTCNKKSIINGFYKTKKLERV